MVAVLLLHAERRWNVWQWPMLSSTRRSLEFPARSVTALRSQSRPCPYWPVVFQPAQVVMVQSLKAPVGRKTPTPLRLGEVLWWRSFIQERSYWRLTLSLVLPVMMGCVSGSLSDFFNRSGFSGVFHWLSLFCYVNGFCDAQISPLCRELSSCKIDNKPFKLSLSWLDKFHNFSISVSKYCPSFLFFWSGA